MIIHRQIAIQLLKHLFLVNASIHVYKEIFYDTNYWVDKMHHSSKYVGESFF